MRLPLLLLLTTALASSSWIGEEYWTTVSFGGQLLSGRTTADFIRLDGDDNKFVALWMTRTKYPGEHFEAFGIASIRYDGRVCGWFAGLDRFPVEVCGGFRVLSVPPNKRGLRLFEWISGHYADLANTVGFSRHRIAKFDDRRGNITYGDALPSHKSFAAVLDSGVDGSQSILALNGEAFSSYVYLLRLLVPEEPPRRTASREDYYRQQQAGPPHYIHRQPPPPPPTTTQLPPPPRREEPVQFVDGVEEVTVLLKREVIRDQHGNLYEKRIVNGHVYYYEIDPSAVVQNAAPRTHSGGRLRSNKGAHFASIGSGAAPQQRQPDIGSGAVVDGRRNDGEPGIGRGAGLDDSSIGRGARPADRDDHSDFGIGHGAQLPGSPGNDNESNEGEGVQSQPIIGGGAVANPERRQRRGIYNSDSEEDEE